MQLILVVLAALGLSALGIYLLVPVAPPGVLVVLVGRRQRWVMPGQRVWALPLLEKRQELSLGIRSAQLDFEYLQCRGRQLECTIIARYRMAREQPLLQCAVERFLFSSPEDVTRVMQESLKGLLVQSAAAWSPSKDGAERFVDGLRRDAKEDLSKLGFILESLDCPRLRSKDGQSYLAPKEPSGALPSAGPMLKPSAELERRTQAEPQAGSLCCELGCLSWSLEGLLLTDRSGTLLSRLEEGERASVHISQGLRFVPQTRRQRFWGAPPTVLRYLLVELRAEQQRWRLGAVAEPALLDGLAMMRDAFHDLSDPRAADGAPLDPLDTLLSLCSTAHALGFELAFGLGSSVEDATTIELPSRFRKSSLIKTPIGVYVRVPRRFLGYEVYAGNLFRSVEQLPMSRTQPARVALRWLGDHSAMMVLARCASEREATTLRTQLAELLKLPSSVWTREPRTRFELNPNEGIEEGVVKWSIHIDRAECIGCEACVQAAPEVFTMDHNDVAKVLDPSRGTDENLGIALSVCPVDCIKIEPKPNWSFE
ncbi:MAG: ferredoxin [Myxococcota bacterium]|jgi:ferredoxin|nr:ferredoxin [Myxococcota bacterium]